MAPYRLVSGNVQLTSSVANEATIGILSNVLCVTRLTLAGFASVIWRRQGRNVVQLDSLARALLDHWTMKADQSSKHCLLPLKYHVWEVQVQAGIKLSELVHFSPPCLSPTHDISRYQTERAARNFFAYQ
jgi:hypothetical protein